MGQDHVPSRARRIVQEAKSGGSVAVLAGEAAALPDAYHAAWALLQLAREDTSLRDKGLAKLREVPEAWRQAELVAQAAKWLRDDPDALQALCDVVAALPASAARSKALRSLAMVLPSHLIPELLAVVVRQEAAVEDGKTLLRSWAKKPQGSVEGALAGARGDGLARLLGYLHLQGTRRGEPLVPDALKRAAEAAEGVETLRYLARTAGTADELRWLADRDLAPLERGRLLSAVAARADQIGEAAAARDWVRVAIGLLDDITDAGGRGSLQANLAKAASKLGMPEATRLQGSMPSAARDAKSPAGDDGSGGGVQDPDPARKQPDRTAATRAEKTLSPARQRVGTLALYNGYTGGLSPAHLRQVARAAGLCVAFDLDLFLIGFPGEDAASLVRSIETETRIGEGGHYCARLLAEGRIGWAKNEHHAEPDAWGVAGAVVATTPHPAHGKQVELEDVGEAPVLVMGMGPQGLPKPLLDAASYHLELTGRNVSLETATAMGVLAERLSARSGRD